jgi:hypothetical protein
MAVDLYDRAAVWTPGSLDDGTPEGIQKIHIASSELIKIPFRDGYYAVEYSGPGEAWKLQTAGQFAIGNSDGSNTCLFIQAPVANTQSGGSGGVRVWVKFSGRRFGLRWCGIQAAAYDLPIGVWIDGVSYEARYHVDPVWATELPAGIPAYNEHSWLCPDLLADTTHIARIYFPLTNQSGSIQHYIYGMIVERRPGFQDPVTPRTAVPVAAGVLTNAMAAIPITGSLNQNPLFARYVRRIDYCNVDSAGHTVSLQVNGLVIWQAVLGAAGTATASSSWPPVPTADMGINGGTDATYASYVQHKADAGSVVNYAVWGGGQ